MAILESEIESRFECESESGSESGIESRIQSRPLPECESESESGSNFWVALKCGLLVVVNNYRDISFNVGHGIVCEIPIIMRDGRS